MSKTISQIQNEIANFYLSIQDEITDVSTGSVAGGLIYAFSVALKELYDNLDELERQAFIATAEGRYLDLLIEGGFFLPRPSSTRSTGYVLVYADDPILNPAEVGNGLVCADYDFENDVFLSDLASATKFTGTNSFGSSAVSYVLTAPKNSLFVRRDSLGRQVIDLGGKNAKYLLLPVASVLRGSQVNLNEGSLDTFSNPPSGLRYVSNVGNPAEIIFNFGGVSTAPLYSRNTTLLEYNIANKRMRVVNAFNFSSKGFLEVAYRSDFPTRLIRGLYRSNIGEEVNAGIVFEYGSKTQTNISIEDITPYVLRFNDNILTRYDIVNFTYEGITYSFNNSTNSWSSSVDTIIGSGSVPNIGPSTFVSNNAFFQLFFSGNPWVVQQLREQVSDDIIFDPDNVLTETYSIREGFRLSRASDRFTDSQYRNYFSRYVNSLPRATNSALEFAALQVQGITFAKTVPSEELPVGTAVLLAASENGQLSPDRKQAVYNFLKDDWVGAGVELFVKSPELLDFNLSLSVKLENPAFENSVKDAINISISEYLRSKLPGDEIRYSEVYSILSGIFGVRSVSELIIGKFDAKHYSEYAGNYARVALKKLEDYRPDEYFTTEESSFRELNNEIIISTDINNGVFLEPVSFNNFKTLLDPSYVFSDNNKDSNNNPTVYAAVNGIFSSDGGGAVSSSTDYSFQPYSNLSPTSSVLGLRFRTSSTDAVISVTSNGNTIISSDVSEFRTVFIDTEISSSDINISFLSSSNTTISAIQSFVHSETFDSHLVGDYAKLKDLTFIDNNKIKFIYGILTPSNRYVKLLTVGYREEDFPGRLEALFTALVGARLISRFQTILRDFQYGQDVSGANSGFFEDSFADISKSDDPFIHFFSYALTSPFAQEFDREYPLIPEDARNRDISNYRLSTRQISRFKQSIINPRVGLVPLIGIRIN